MNTSSLAETVSDKSGTPRRTSSTVEPTPRELTPHPGNLLLGSAFDAWKNPITLFGAATRDADVVRFRFVYLDYFLLNDPAAIQHVLVANPGNYVKSRSYAGLKAVLGQGLLTSEGDFWRRQRKLSQPAFHRDKLSGFVDTMARFTADMLERWKRELEPSATEPGRGSFDAHAQMMRLTFRIVGQTLLSTDFDGEAKAVGDALNVALVWANRYAEALVRIPPWVPTPSNLRFGQAKKKLEDLVMGVIDDRRRGRSSGDDLLDMLMAARDEQTGEGMDDRQLKDELLTLVLAGHETTANALTFTLYLLSRHPEVRRRVEEEVARVLEDRTPKLEDLKKLEYTKLVVEESMRLYPPAWVFEREALEDDIVAGAKIPKGATVGISPFMLHRNPALWPNPEGFDPERMNKPRGKHDYLPFGAGPRFCIGNSFAMMEMLVLLPMMLRAYELRLAPGFQLTLDPATTLRPKDPVPMTLHPR